MRLASRDCVGAGFAVSSDPFVEGSAFGRNATAFITPVVLLQGEGQGTSRCQTVTPCGNLTLPYLALLLFFALIWMEGASGHTHVRQFITDVPAPHHPEIAYAFEPLDLSKREYEGY